MRIRRHTVRVPEQRSRLLRNLYGEIVRRVIVIAAMWVGDSFLAGILCEVRRQNASLVIQPRTLHSFQQFEQIVRCPPKPVRTGGCTLARRRRQSILFGVHCSCGPPAHMLPFSYTIHTERAWTALITYASRRLESSYTFLTHTFNCCTNKYTLPHFAQIKLNNALQTANRVKSSRINHSTLRPPIDK